MLVALGMAVMMVFMIMRMFVFVMVLVMCRFVVVFGIIVVMVDLVDLLVVVAFFVALLGVSVGVVQSLRCFRARILDDLALNALTMPAPARPRGSPGYSKNVMSEPASPVSSA